VREKKSSRNKKCLTIEWLTCSSLFWVGLSYPLAHTCTLVLGQCNRYGTTIVTAVTTTTATTTILTLRSSTREQLALVVFSDFYVASVENYNPNLSYPIFPLPILPSYYYSLKWGIHGSVIRNAVLSRIWCRQRGSHERPWMTCSRKGNKTQKCMYRTRP